MQLLKPWDCSPGLTEDRLRLIAERLLEVRHETLRVLSTDLDDNYVRETAVFGRCRKLLIALAQDPKLAWLRLRHSALDVTAEIGGTPFRYFRDDPDQPEKLGFFKRNAVDDLFDPDEKAPVMWRFVVERALGEEDADRAHFVGYNVFGEKVSQWTLANGGSGTLASVDRNVPPARSLPPPEVLLRDDDDTEDALAKAS